LPTPSGEVQTWLFEQFAGLLAGIFETMTGERPVVKWEPVPRAPTEPTLSWKQPFTGVPGMVWMAATEADWSGAAGYVLQAAGIPESDAASLKSTYLEIAGQALSGLEQALSGRLGREVVRTGGEETADQVGEAAWMVARLTLGPSTAGLYIGFENALVHELEVNAPDVEPKPEPETKPQTSEGANSKTFDLLLDVELPVSVSFGRAQVALKDVLKLTTGSIVELNRSVAEPVEVIVNNCVIARGEVVVVEGNFGVRIQEVISRQERLRTLN
jgi:flagellar motor switch protein FliN/FliY